MTTRRARRYQRGSLCKSENGEIWYGKYYPAPGAPQKRVQLGRSSEMNEKQARTALDDIIALLNRNPAHALGSRDRCEGSLNRCTFRRNTKTEIGEKPPGRRPSTCFGGRSCLRSANCGAAILRPTHLRAVLRKLAGTGLSYESVSKVRFAMGDMVKRMVAEEYLILEHRGGSEDAKDGEAVGSFPPASGDAGRVLGGMDCSG